MDELDRALRDVLTEERLDVPMSPDALRIVHAGVRRRRRRRTIAAVTSVATSVVVVAGAGVLLAGPGADSVRQPIGPAPLTTAKPSPTTAVKPTLPPATTTVVPWSDAAYDPAKPPAFPGTVADPAVPWCKAAQLTLEVRLLGATGNLGGALDLTNQSAQTCAVQGEPAVQVRSDSGRVLVASQPDPFFVTAWVKLTPGTSASAPVEWMQEFCKQPAPAVVTVTLPHGGGVVTAASTDAPRCNGPTDPPSAGSLRVLGFISPTETGAPEPFTPEVGLQATVVRWQRAAVNGELVDYRLQLQDIVGSGVRLDPCLPYRERLVERTTGAVVAEETHLLNCDAAPATIPAPPSQQQVLFDLQLRLPTTVEPGDYSLVWQSVLEPVDATAPDVVHVTAAPPQCAEGQLTLGKGASGVATGHYSDVVVFTNNTASPCTLRGYPGVQWVDDTGRGLATSPHHGGSFTFPDLPVTTVVLAAHGGTASFAVGGLDFVPPAGATPCTSTSGLLVIPPGLRHQVLVKDVGTDCQSGALDVSVVVPGSRGPRF